MSEFQKLVAVGMGILLISVLLFYFSGGSTFDFSKFKYGLNPNLLTEPVKEKPSKRPASDSEVLAELESRGEVINRDRAKIYVNTAWRDYYNGYFEDALRRLGRAKQYDPGSYEALKLSGQILFEQNYYRKAFNDWSRATQLPNDDKSMSRDLDVVKRLIRYCRNEIDRLQLAINKNPGDQLSLQKLRELKQRMEE